MAGLQKVRELTVDTMIPRNFSRNEDDLKTHYFYQGDINSAKFLLNITHEGAEQDLSTATKVQIAFLKPDGKRVFQDCSNVNPIKGKYYVVLSTQSITTAGNVIAQIRITFPDTVVETTKFVFSVAESIMSDQAVESSDEFPAIQKAIEVGEKLEGKDIDGIIAAGAKADAAIAKSTENTNQIGILSKKTEIEIQKSTFDRRKKIPLLSIVTDDGDIQDLEVLKVLLDKKGVKATFAVPVKHIGMGGHLTLEQCLQMQEDGWEMASHTYNHVKLTDVSLEEVEYELSESKKKLTELGFKVDNLVYPNGAYNDDIMKIAKKYFKYSMTTDDGINTGVFGSQMIYRVSVYSHSLDEMKAMIDETVAKNGWLILYTHGVLMDEGYMKKLSDAIDYAMSLKIPVVTAREALNKVGNALEFGLFNDKTKSEQYFAVSSDGKVDFYDSQFMRWFLEKPNGRTINSPASAYKDNAITEIAFNSQDNGGFPSAAGTLQTHNVKGGSSSIPWQLWHTTSTNLVYKRSWNIGTNSWGTFLLINDVPVHRVEETRNIYSASTLITDFPKNRITTFYYNSTGATGFPVTAGTVTTYRMNEDLWSRQELREYKSNAMWTRYYDGTNWTAWEQLNIPPTTWTGLVTIGTTFKALGTTKCVNFVDFEKLYSSSGTQPTLSKTLWAASEISTDNANPTTIGTAGALSLQVYKDANNIIYVKYSGSGNSYPTFFRTSYC